MEGALHGVVAQRAFFVCCTWLHALPLSHAGVIMRLLFGSVVNHAVAQRDAGLH